MRSILLGVLACAVAGVLAGVLACGGAAPVAPTASHPAPAPPVPTVIEPAASPAAAPASPAALAAGALGVEVRPAPAYLEVGAGAQLVNCDLLVDNGTARAWRLAELTLSVYDRTGALAFRKLVNGNGVAPGVQVVPAREVAARSQLLVMNPLFELPLDLDAARLGFELVFEAVVPADADAPALRTTVEVAPVRHVGQASLRLPLGGRVLVWDGHDFLSHHRRWDYLSAPIRALGFTSNAGRYAYDLVVVDAAGAMHHGDPADNASWLGFGAPVLAPAAGTVVAVVDTRPDDRTIDMAALASDLFAVYGNFVVVDHGRGEVSLLGHVRQGSATVKVGDRVTEGQPLAAVGASGSSLFPHLHYQLQSDATANAEGVPSAFDAFTRVRGTTRIRVPRGTIDSGDLVER